MAGGARRRASLLGALVALAGLIAPGPGQAQPAPRARIVLFAAPGDPLAGRLAAEIEAQGLDVERQPTPAPDAVEAAVHETLLAGARVAVLADAGRMRTEVWSAAASNDPHRIAVKQALAIDDAADPEAALPVLALRTVELLRVGFGLGAAPPPVAVAETPPPPSSSPSTPVTIAVGSGILAGTGRVGPLPIAGLSLGAQLGRLFGAELWGYAPLVSDRLTDSAGTARTSIWLAGAGLLLAPPPWPRVALDFGAGPMLALVRATGTADQPAAGTTDQQIGVALYARAAARLRLGARWSVGLQLIGGGAIRRPVITFVHQDVTRWGTAFFATVATAGYTF